MYYTKYRPQKFSELLKPNDVAKALQNQIKSKKAVHAYLFVGPRGTGKTTTARILAKALNCSKLEKDGDPCDKCESCVGIRNGSFLDLIEIDAASNRGIDDIRDLREKVKLAPSVGKHKIYIIDEVHMLTTEAFNALLKTLEEPPKHVVFILCTTEDHKIPDTIKSRCQIFKFKRASVDQIVEKLENICEKEKKKMRKADLKKIAQAAFGGFRDAETILEQVVEGDLDVNSFLGSITSESYMDFVDSLLQKDANSALRQVNKQYDDGVDLFVWTMELTKYLRDLLFILSDAHEGLVDVTDEVFSRMEEQACKYEASEIVFMIEVFMKAQNNIKSSFIPQLPLELAIVTICENPQGYEAGAASTDISPENGSDNGSNDKKRPSAKDFSINDDELGSKWQRVLKSSIEHNHSVNALLKATRVVSVENGYVNLEVFYAFHKERLESMKNRQIVENVIEEVFGAPLILKCILAKKPKTEKKTSGKETGELTDYNVAVPSDVKVDDTVLDVFDGNLPL